MLLVTRTAGGLGNQLFQYCAAKHYSEMLGVKSALILKRWHVTRYPNIDDVLVIDLPRATNLQRIRVGDVPEHWARWKRLPCRVLIEIGKRAMPVVKVHDSEDLANPVPADIPRDARRVLVDGTFQMSQSYEPYVDAVCREILQRAPERPSGLGDNRVAVSFRRGDYVPLGWTLTWSYYRESLDKLSISKDHAIWVLSDDAGFAELAAHRLRAEGFAVEQVPSIGSSPALNDFWAMAYAEKLVSSNSSFAWWAAAVGDTLRGPSAHDVVVPRPWLAFFEPSLLRRAHWSCVDVIWND